VCQNCYDDCFSKFAHCPKEAAGTVCYIKMYVIVHELQQNKFGMNYAGMLVGVTSMFDLKWEFF
jgi:hypothetical protein